jgi:hypothetical protein
MLDERAVEQLPPCHHSDVQSRGWTYPFRSRSWDALSAFYSDLAEREESFAYLSDIVRSVLDSSATALLAGQTLMNDLVVVDTPVRAPPLEVVVVRAPGSLHPPTTGHVLIEHQSLTGHDDRIERPAAEAVPLFWRFMTEKFGVTPGR